MEITTKKIGINQLKILTGTTISQMQFNAIFSAIPNQWKSTMTKYKRPIIENTPINTHITNTGSKNTEIMIKLYNRNKHITLITNKDIYNTLINQMIKIQPQKISGMTYTPF